MELSCARPGRSPQVSARITLKKSDIVHRRKERFPGTSSRFFQEKGGGWGGEEQDNADALIPDDEPRAWQGNGAPGGREAGKRRIGGGRNEREGTRS